MKTTVSSALFTLGFAAALAQPLSAAEPKRLLLCTVTTGFRHSSIPIAQETLKKLAEQSGDFTIVETAEQPTLPVVKKPAPPKKPADLAANADDAAKAKYAQDLVRYEGEQKKYAELLAKWTPEDEAKLKAFNTEFEAAVKASLEKLSPAHLIESKIDGVIFANTTGDLPLPNRDGFIQWIEAGHAFMAMHSATDTFHRFPGYLEMIQGEFQTHRFQVPADLIAADQTHPANAGLGAKWNIGQEEVYLIKNQDRAKVRALWYLNHDPNFPDQVGFFPVSWCRMAGKGRVFYTSLGHREDLWSDDPQMKDRKNSVEISKQYRAHILGGIRWALGLAEGSSTPNPEVK